MNSKRHLPIAIRFSIITLTVIVICMPFRMPSLSQSYSNHYYENYIASGASEIPVQISYYSEVLQNDTAEIEINANVDIPAVDQIDVVIGTSFIPDQERALSAFFPYSDFFDSIELYQVYSSRMYDIKQTGFSCPQGSVYISESGEISLEYFEPIIHIESEEDIWELLDRAGYPVDQMILQRTEGGTYILFSAMDDIPVSSYPAFDKFTEYPTDGASMIIETNNDYIYRISGDCWVKRNVIYPNVQILSLTSAIDSIKSKMIMDAEYDQIRLVYHGRFTYGNMFTQTFYPVWEFSNSTDPDLFIIVNALNGDVESMSIKE